jgi:hypothetical protein
VQKHEPKLKTKEPELSFCEFERHLSSQGLSHEEYTIALLKKGCEAADQQKKEESKKQPPKFKTKQAHQDPTATLVLHFRHLLLRSDRYDWFEKLEPQQIDETLKLIDDDIVEYSLENPMVVCEMVCDPKRVMCGNNLSCRCGDPVQFLHRLKIVVRRRLYKCLNEDRYSNVAQIIEILISFSIASKDQAKGILYEIIQDSLERRLFLGKYAQHYEALLYLILYRTNYFGGDSRNRQNEVRNRFKNIKNLRKAMNMLLKKIFALLSSSIWINEIKYLEKHGELKDNKKGQSLPSLYRYVRCASPA